MTRVREQQEDGALPAGRAELAAGRVKTTDNWVVWRQKSPLSIGMATVDQLQPRKLGVAGRDRVELGARQYLLSDEA